MKNRTIILNSILFTIGLTVCSNCGFSSQDKAMNQNIKSHKYDKVISYIKKMPYPLDQEVKNKLIDLIKPTIGMKSQSKKDEDIQVGVSKIGGKPDLPSEFDWPRINNSPMLFCAQYNLKDLAKYDVYNQLPKNGLLSLFVSLDEEYKEFNGIGSKFKLIIHELSNLKRTEFPRDLISERKFKPAKIVFYELYSLPHYEHPSVASILNDNDGFLYDPYDQLSAYINTICSHYEDNFHQILGYDRAVQSSAVYDFAQLELGVYASRGNEITERWNEIIELSKNYDLLLQLDTGDSNTDLERFGSGGVLYFGITKKDLSNQKFDEIKMTHQW